MAIEAKLAKGKTQYLTFFLIEGNSQFHTYWLILLNLLSEVDLQSPSRQC